MATEPLPAFATFLAPKTDEEAERARLYVIRLRHNQRWRWNPEPWREPIVQKNQGFVVDATTEVQ